MVSILFSSAADLGFEPQLGQTKENEIASAKQAALRRKNTDWLARIQDNVSEWGDIMSIRRLLFQ